MTEAYAFLNGAIALGAWVAGLFFRRFWTRTGERLFRIFGYAFFTMGLERIVLVALGGGEYVEHQAYVYLVRLAGFLIILFAIVDKNLVRRPPGGNPGT